MNFKIEKFLTNKGVLKIFTLVILFFVPMLSLLSLFLERNGFLNNINSINPAIVMWISMPFLIYVYIEDTIDKKRKINLYDYIFFLLVFTSLLSVIFSLDKSIAIFGKSYRHEGFLTVLCYYLLFINWKNVGTKEDAKKFIKLLLLIGLINSIYAFFQVYTDLPFIVKSSDYEYLAIGFCGHHNFLGSLMVIVLSIVTCQFFMEKINWKNIVLLFIFFITLINTQSSGPFLAYIITCIFIIIFLFIKKKLVLKNFLLVFLLMLVLIPTYLFVYYLNNDIKNLERCELCEAGIEESIRSGANGRMEIWSNSLEIVKKYPLVGVGFDNLYLAYPNRLMDSNIIIFSNFFKEQVIAPPSPYIDNAHNVYIHILASTGIIGLIPYLILCLLTFIRGLKSKDNLYIMLFVGFVAYSVQAFSNISVIGVAPIYYIIIGIILSNKE